VNKPSRVCGSPTKLANKWSIFRLQPDRLKPFRFHRTFSQFLAGGYAMPGNGLPLVSGRNGATRNPRMKNKPIMVAAGP
jgi:phytoene dehydrogenase-like protein